MAKINETENDQYIIISEDRIKELVIEIYDIIYHTKYLTAETYKRLMKEIAEILRTYEYVLNSNDFLQEIKDVRNELYSYAKDLGILNETRTKELRWD